MGKRERDLQVESPRKCIKRYCLRHCEKLERRNSKREVAECINRKCPLHPYRTGMLREAGPLSEYAKNRRFIRLKTARKKVERLEQILAQTNGKLEKAELRADSYREQKEETKQDIAEAKRNLERLEMAFSDELEAGLWK